MTGITVGSTVLTGGTQGSVLFVGAASVIQQDNANFFWDEVEARDGQVYAAETYDHDQTTFSTVAKRLVAESFNSGLLFLR